MRSSDGTSTRRCPVDKFGQELPVAKPCVEFPKADAHIALLLEPSRPARGRGSEAIEGTRDVFGAHEFRYLRPAG